MSNQIHDASLRATIKAALKEAIPGLKAIHSGSPQIPKDWSSLPYAALRLGSFEQAPDNGALAALLATYRYDILLIAKWPKNITVEEDKMLKSNAILDKLTEQRHFGPEGIGRYRVVEKIDYAEGQAESGEPIYSFMMTFRIDVDAEY